MQITFDILLRLMGLAELASADDVPDAAAVRRIAEDAAREIEMLRGRLAATIDGAAKPVVPVDQLAVDLSKTDQRLSDLAAAMREVARKESIHPSVRFLADTIAINLGGPARG